MTSLEFRQPWNKIKENIKGKQSNETEIRIWIQFWFFFCLFLLPPVTMSAWEAVIAWWVERHDFFHASPSPCSSFARFLFILFFFYFRVSRNGKVHYVVLNDWSEWFLKNCLFLIFARRVTVRAEENSFRMNGRTPAYWPEFVNEFSWILC